MEKEKLLHQEVLAAQEQLLHSERRESSAKIDQMTTEISAKDRALTTVEN